MGDFFKDHIFAGHAVAGCSAVALSSSLTHPIDTLKTVLQVSFTITFFPIYFFPSNFFDYFLIFFLNYF